MNQYIIRVSPEVTQGVSLAATSKIEKKKTNYKTYPQQRLRQSTKDTEVLRQIYPINYFCLHMTY